MRRLLLLVSALLTVSAGSLAQANGAAVTLKPRGAGMEVRQYTLQVLSGSEAVSLLTPFVPFEDGGGIWRSSGSVISVVGNKRTLAIVDSVLKSYDHAPATLVFRFMLIAATDSAVSDPRIGEVDVELRRLLKFNGYRRLAEATSVVSEGASFTSTMSAADSGEFTLDGGVKSVRDGRVALVIQLRSGTTGVKMGLPTTASSRQLLSTTLTVPIGQTVVLGTAAGEKGMAALILTVRPELPELTGRQTTAPPSSERTYEFKIHYGSSSFDGILRVLGDSMEIESPHGYCVAELGRPSSERRHFKCEGLTGVANLRLALDVQNVRERSRWLGTVNDEQTNGPTCVQYRGSVCVAWRPTVGDFKKSVGDRIVLTPKPSPVPPADTGTFAFRVQYGGATFDGTLRTFGDSMTVESEYAFCTPADRSRMTSRVEESFSCTGMPSLSGFVLTFDARNPTTRSRWQGYYTRRQDVGQECILYTTNAQGQSVCTKWQRKLEDRAVQVGDKILFLPTPP